MPTRALIDARSRDVLIERAGRVESVGDLFRTTSAGLRRLVPFDAAVYMATDPATNLPTTPTLSENMTNRGLEQEDCVSIWEREFQVEDVNLYRDLARSETPAAGLRMATEDQPARSPRYRETLQPLGFDDELRAVMRADGSPWASITLFRERGRPPFDAAEAELVASLSGPLGDAVRAHAQPTRRTGAGTDGQSPGLILFAPGGELISVNDEGRAWLDELAWFDEMQPEPGEHFGLQSGSPHPGARGTTFGLRLPLVVMSTLMRARAIAEEREHGAARARLRSPASGRWLVCHASCLREANGEMGDTALVIEPAKASESPRSSPRPMSSRRASSRSRG